MPDYRFRSAAAAVIMCAWVQGCSRTVVTGKVTYPVDAADSGVTHTLFIESRGALGRAYTDRTAKSVSLFIYTQNSLRSSTNIFLVAGNLCWTVSWSNESRLSVLFVEPGETKGATNVVKRFEMEL